VINTTRRPGRRQEEGLAVPGVDLVPQSELAQLARIDRRQAAAIRPVAGIFEFLAAVSEPVDQTGDSAAVTSM
jgi:hypothetical protein